MTESAERKKLEELLRCGNGMLYSELADQIEALYRPTPDPAVVERVREIRKKFLGISHEKWEFDSYNVIHAGRDKIVASIPDHPDGESSFASGEISERSAWHKESEANAWFIEKAPEYINWLLNTLETLLGIKDSK